MRFLIDKGANFRQINDDGDTLLHLAAVSCATASCEILLEAGLSANAINKEGITPLHLAAASGFSSICEILAAHGANLDSTDLTKGNTALHEAAMNGYREACETLLQLGANPRIKNQTGRLPQEIIPSGRQDLLALFERYQMLANVSNHQENQIDLSPSLWL